MLIPARDLFCGGAFLLLGAITLLFNRMLTDEGRKINEVFRTALHPSSVHPSLARVIVIDGAIVEMLLGIALLARIIN